MAKMAPTSYAMVVFTPSEPATSRIPKARIRTVDKETPVYGFGSDTKVSGWVGAFYSEKLQ